MAYTLQPLAPLHPLTALYEPGGPGAGYQPGGDQFLPGGSGDGSSAGNTGGLVIGSDIGAAYGAGLTGQGLPGQPSQVTETFASSCSIFSPSTWAGCVANQLLRIVLLILGILCIAGAIYLYKPTNDAIVQPVLKTAKGATEAAAAAAAAA